MKNWFHREESLADEFIEFHLKIFEKHFLCEI